MSEATSGMRGYVCPGFRYAHPGYACLGEFILPYDAVRTADAPERELMAFLQSTYEAAADLAKWDRAALECGLGEKGKVRVV